VKGIGERASAFRKEKASIHVANGVLDLPTDSPRLLPFSHEHMSRNRSEIPYVPEAACPRFLGELLGPALDADDISLLQRIAGQCLIGVNLAQKILLILGTAAGGKSTLVSILEKIIGMHNVANVRVAHMEGRFEMAGYLGKTLLTGKDVRSDFLDSEAAYTLKPLVGGDHLEAEKKNGRHRVGFVGEFNVIITANSRLVVNLDSDVEAWRRRLLIVDYVNPPVAKPRPKFASELVREEGPGILNWCVEGARQLLAELKEFGRVQLTDAQRRRVDDLLDESDSVRQFASLQLANERGGSVTVAELQVAYVDFCMGRGWQPRPVHQFDRSIAKVMLELHRSPKRTDIKRDDRNQRGFAHVVLCPSPEVEASS
jgi:P4 family phage/plasmid primase-like protien